MSSFVRSIATTSCQSLDGFKTAHAYATPVAAIATRSDASDRHALSQVERDRTSRRREILSADDVPHRHHRRGAEIAVVQPRCASRLSGTVGIDVSTGQMAASSIQEQTRHALRNCTAILQAGRSHAGRCRPVHGLTRESGRLHGDERGVRQDVRHGDADASSNSRFGRYRVSDLSQDGSDDDGRLACAGAGDAECTFGCESFIGGPYIIESPARRAARFRFVNQRGATVEQNVNAARTLAALFSAEHAVSDALEAEMRGRCGINSGQFQVLVALAVG